MTVFQGDNKELTDTEIVGVAHLDRYKSCLRCKARVEPQVHHLEDIPERIVQCYRSMMYAQNISLQN